MMINQLVESETSEMQPLLSEKTCNNQTVAMFNPFAISVLL